MNEKRAHRSRHDGGIALPASRPSMLAKLFRSLSSTALAAALAVQTLPAQAAAPVQQSQAAQPIQQVNQYLTRVDAFHVLVRSGYQPSQDEISTFLTDVQKKLGTRAAFASQHETRQAAVQVLLDGLTCSFAVAPPDDLTRPYDLQTNPGPQSSDARFTTEGLRRFNNWRFYARGWMVQQMADPKANPLTERLVRFYNKVWVTARAHGPGNGYWFSERQKLLRNYIGGCSPANAKPPRKPVSYLMMVKGIVKDPAMLLFLTQAGADGSNGKKPTANFARETLELFTVGLLDGNNQRNYSEDDVITLSKIYSGMNYDRDKTDAFRWDQNLHNLEAKSLHLQDGAETKTLNIAASSLTSNGEYEVDQALKLILKDSNTAKRLVRRLWQEFVSDTLPREETINDIALVFKGKDYDTTGVGYDLKVALGRLLMTREFWDWNHLMIRSPEETVIGAMRMLKIVPPDNFVGSTFYGTISAMGVNLESPRTVLGDPAGADSISTINLQGRVDAFDWVIHIWGSSPGSSWHPWGPPPKLNGSQRGGTALDDLLPWEQRCPVKPMLMRDDSETPTQRLKRMLADPACQLK